MLSKSPAPPAAPNDFHGRVAAAISAPVGADTSHMGRYLLIVEMINTIARRDMKVIDLGSSGQMLPALISVVGLSDITINSGGSGDDYIENEHTARLCERPPTADGTIYSAPYHQFDLEQAFPVSDALYDLVIFTEVLEHLTRDPMLTMSEINRITKTGGWLMLETPNSASLRSFVRCLRGDHPQIWSQYSPRGIRDRHNREYTANEVKAVIECAGYRIADFRTADDAYSPYPAPASTQFKRSIAKHLLHIAGLATGSAVSPSLRGDATFVMAQKIGPVSNRFPEFLYGSH